MKFIKQGDCREYGFSITTLLVTIIKWRKRIRGNVTIFHMPGIVLKIISLSPMNWVPFFFF